MKKSPYIFIIIALSALALLICLFIHLVNINTRNVRQALEVEGIKSEASLVNNFDQTASIISNMNLQIAKNPWSDKHIFNILKSYRTHPSLDDVFYWTIFSWVDAKNNVSVDGVYGVLEKPIYIFEPRYLKLTRKDPWKFHLGIPIMGPTSKKWIITAGSGLVDKKKNYVGSLVIGLKIDALARIVQDAMSKGNVTVKLFDTNANLPIFTSSSKTVKVFKSEEWKITKKEKNILDRLKTSDKSLYDIDIFDNKDGYFAKKISGYNYAIILKYENEAIRSEFWNSVKSKKLELIAIFLISGILMFLIYKEQYS